MQGRPQVGGVVGYPLIDQLFFSRESACRFVFSDVVTLGQVVEDRTYRSQGNLRISCNLPVLGASQFGFAQKRKGDFQSGGVVCSIFILEGVVWPCLAPDIRYEMVGMKVEVASGIDERQIELAAFFGHL